VGSPETCFNERVRAERGEGESESDALNHRVQSISQSGDKRVLRLKDTRNTLRPRNVADSRSFASSLGLSHSLLTVSLTTLVCGSELATGIGFTPAGTPESMPEVVVASLSFLGAFPALE